jgi:DNA-binding CsgD family transcriptional regulator
VYDDDLASRVAGLEAALATSAVTGQAVGILMERHRVDADQARAMLERTSASEGADLADVARRLVATGWLDHAEAERAARALDGTVLGGSVPARVEDQHGLSPRESQVIAFIASGATNLEIAEALYLGVNTVKTYIRTAYRKIGVTRRAQAVIWGREHGLLELVDRVDASDPAYSVPTSRVDVPAGEGSHSRSISP